MRLLLTIAVLLFTSANIFGNQLSDDQIKDNIVKKSVESYLTSIGNCPCPYNRDKIGHLCGKRSAWSRVGGNSPLCYRSDITSDMLLKYKHNILPAP
jgi:hypothetical protein